MRDLGANAEPGIDAFDMQIERMQEATSGLRPTRDGPDVYTPRISRRYHPTQDVNEERFRNHEHTLAQVQEEMRRLRHLLGEND